MSKRNLTRVERNDLDDDVDALFRLPLAEFTGARNALAARLKKSGRGDEAIVVKALAKPPVSAWAVNQLYWNHREAFDRLIASGERFHKAQTSAAKVGDTRTALDARREALTHLSDLATSLLRDASPNPGHSPSLDTTRRITSTLEAVSAMSATSGRVSRSDAPRPGSLTDDVDPPGFESLASWVPTAGVTRATKEPARLTPSPKSAGPPPSTLRKVVPDDGVRQREEKRKAKITAAKASLHDAKRLLTEARATAQSLEAAKKKADAEAKKTEKNRRDAEEELRKAKAAAEAAKRRARNVTLEAGEAARAVDDAERTFEKTSQDLDSLLRES